MNRVIQAACIQAAATLLAARYVGPGAIDVVELAELVERLYTATIGEKYERTPTP